MEKNGICIRIELCERASDTIHVHMTVCVVPGLTGFEVLPAHSVTPMLVIGDHKVIDILFEV